MCYHPSGYVIFSLRKLKFYWGWGLGAGGRVSDNPNTRYSTIFSTSLLLGSIDYCVNDTFVIQCVWPELIRNLTYTFYHDVCTTVELLTAMPSSIHS